MKSVKAFVIYDENNPVSKMYLEKSLESFADTPLSIEKVQCVTPATLAEQKPVLKFTEDYVNDKYIGVEKKYTDGEKACFNSHYLLWKEAAKSKSRFIILEHDAFLRSRKKLDMFLPMLKDSFAWNPGLWFECYSVEQSLAKFLEQRYETATIEIGPMAEFQETASLFFDYHKHYLIKTKNYVFPYFNKIGVTSEPKLLYPPGYRKFSGVLHATPAVTQLWSLKHGPVVKREHEQVVTHDDNPFGFEIID